ncbi:hypothetical protein T07_13125 [Trichinella nelsoni]|uniref:DUF7107 domain-containing protein n=1 Tax=Trichinella nelsoni TaxID=6336 RepID=A0A0V0SF72_9BILA|nr:hypothetical protein T07_13125 [Trichinella nelsoni]
MLKSTCIFGFIFFFLHVKNSNQQVHYCKVHEQCPGDNLCEAQGICTSGRRSPMIVKCQKDGSCGRHGACKHNLCWKFERYFQERCNKQDDCPGQSICDRGQCKPAEPMHTPCQKSSDCKDHGVCKYDMCWKISQKSSNLIIKKQTVEVI